MKTSKKTKVEPINKYENEKWMTVKNHPSYEISSMGRVKHTSKNGKANYVQPSLNSTNKGKRDYQFFMLNEIKHYAHHLVLSHFVGAKPKGYECDHINGDKWDNTLENLRYLTISENRSHKGEKHPSSKLTEPKVKMIRNLWLAKESLGIDQQKLAELFEVTASAISSVITRKTWIHVV